MFTRQIVILSAIVVIVLTFGRGCRSQSCDIDFHMEASSVMLLEGENASMLCDATCYGSNGPIQVFWRDSRGRQIGRYPNRTFSVAYNRGLMNRLLIIGAGLDTAGSYVCTVMRNGELLQQKHLEVVVLGSQGGSDYSYVDTQDNGPRRGDLAPRRDLEYRPVRSVNWARSISDYSQFSDDKINKALQSLKKEIIPKSKENEDARTSPEMNIPFWKMMLAKLNHRQKSDFDRVSPGSSEATKSDNDMKNKREVTQSPGSDNVARRVSFEPKIVNRRIYPDTLSIIRQILPVNRKNSDNFDFRKKVFSIGHQFGRSNDGQQFGRSSDGHQFDQSRVKRQVDQSTTTANTTTEMLSSTDNNTTIGENDTMTTSSGDMPVTTTFNWTDETTDSMTDPTPDESDKITEQEENNNGKIAPQEVTTTPRCSQQEQSNFGKYGVLAFAISLAVAFLLFYSILMIIFMPRMMARRKNKENVEGATYRKQGPDTSATAPLTILDTSEKGDDDLTQGQEETADLGKTDEAETDKKKEETKEVPANVSTFLIRQESQKKTQEETKSGCSEEKSSQPDKGTIPSPTLDQTQTNSLKTPPEKEVTAETKATNQSDDLMSSILPELSLLNSAPVTSQNQLGSTTSADSKSEAVKSPIDSGSNSSTSGGLETDLPPPPPPPEVSGGLSDPVVDV